MCRASVSQFPLAIAVQIFRPDAVAARPFTDSHYGKLTGRDDTAHVARAASQVLGDFLDGEEPVGHSGFMFLPLQNVQDYPANCVAAHRGRCPVAQ